MQKRMANRRKSKKIFGDWTNRDVIQTASYKSELCKSIQNGNEELTRSLLQNGANVNEFSYYRGYGEPPILTAVRFQNFFFIPILLEFSADVNLQSERGHTAIIWAAQKNHLETIKILLHHKADPNIMDNSRLSALYWTVKHGNLEATRELLTHHAEVNVMVQQQSTILHTAASSGQLEIVRMLIDNNACVNTPDEFGNSSLFAAVSVNNFDVSSLLLQTGAVVNVLNMDYRTPLHIAAASVHRSVDITQLLLDHSALVNVADRYGNSPLALSLRNFVLHANFAVAKCLVQHGSDLNTRQCCSALEWTTIAHGNFDLIKLSIFAGFRIINVDWVKDFINGTPGRRRWYTRNDYNIQQERKFIEFLNNHQKNPFSLSDSCRVAIRDWLIAVSGGASIYYSIQKLPLPQPLILYLLLKD